MDKDASWYKITLSKVQIQTNEPLRISGAVATAIVKNGAPPDLALFKKRDEKEPWASATFYLPPSAARYCPDLLKQYLWEECSNPGPDEADVEHPGSQYLDLLIG